jgi:hypothetical protein
MSSRPKTHLLHLLTLLGISTACGDGLVGSHCAEDYVERSGSCVRSIDSSGADSPEAEPPSGAGGGDQGIGHGGVAGHGATHPAGGADGRGTPPTLGPTGGCTTPLVACDGACIDTTSDPAHCGACFNACPTGLCESSACVGSIAGHVIAIGMDYQDSSLATATLLGNAAFLTTAEPVRLVSYRGHAAIDAVQNVEAILRQQALLRSRTLDLVVPENAANVTAWMDEDGCDVLLVHHQASAPAGTLAAIGASWATTLSSFTADGGVVVVLASLEGSDEMPDFLTQAALLDVAHQEDVAGQTVHNIGWLDAVGQGVPSPLLANNAAAAFVSTEPPSPTVSYVMVTDTNDPLVIHKAFFATP